MLLTADKDVMRIFLTYIHLPFVMNYFEVVHGTGRKGKLHPVYKHCNLFSNLLNPVRVFAMHIQGGQDVHCKM